MPKLRRTQEQIREDCHKNLRENIISVIRIRMAEMDVRTLKELSSLTGIRYDYLTRRMCGQVDFDCWTMALIVDALHIDEHGCAAMLDMNRKKKK